MTGLVIALVAVQSVSLFVQVGLYGLVQRIVPRDGGPQLRAVPRD